MFAITARGGRPFRDSFLGNVDVLDAPLSVDEAAEDAVLLTLLRLDDVEERFLLPAVAFFKSDSMA